MTNGKKMRKVLPIFFALSTLIAPPHAFKIP